MPDSGQAIIWAKLVSIPGQRLSINIKSATLRNDLIPTYVKTGQGNT